MGQYFTFSVVTLWSCDRPQCLRLVLHTHLCADDPFSADGLSCVYTEMMKTPLLPPSELPVPAGAPSSCVGGVAMLTLQNVSCRDEGLYVCVAENSHGRAESSAQLLVKGQRSY